MPNELISRKTRTEFREFLVGWTLREIRAEFDGEYIECIDDYVPPMSGERRSLVEQYYKSLDFKKHADVQRLLRVYENILNKISPGNPEGAQTLVNFLKRDGYLYQDGSIRNVSHDLPTLDQARQAANDFDATYMAMQIRRIENAIESDPDLAVGSSKELLESCCKTILSDRSCEIPKDPDLTQLVRLTMEELKLLPEDIADETKGSKAIKGILGGLSGIAKGLTEVRNLYGSGHGKHGRTSSLKPRHAKLAVGAATTLVVFLFETHRETMSRMEEL